MAEMTVFKSRTHRFTNFGSGVSGTGKRRQVMIGRVVLFILLAFPVFGFTDDRAFETVETRVFVKNTPDYLKGLYTNEGGMGTFQNALVDYRLGTLTTNIDLVRKSLQAFSNALSSSTNVFNITYYGLAFSSVMFITPNIFEKLPVLGQSFQTLDRAVELYPKHYLPHFYRSMMKLMAPSIVGGSEEVGLKDMEFVLSNMASIRRGNEYKAFIHFFYGIYWGEMKKDTLKAESFLSNADKLSESEEMKKNIAQYRKKYEEKRSRS
jgi:hypothetical protein